jgi:hypothetical protein
MANGSVTVLRTQTRLRRHQLPSMEAIKHPATLRTVVHKHLALMGTEASKRLELLHTAANKVLETRHTEVSKRLGKLRTADRQYLVHRLKAGAEVN